MANSKLTNTGGRIICDAHENVYLKRGMAAGMNEWMDGGGMEGRRSVSCCARGVQVERESGPKKG